MNKADLIAAMADASGVTKTQAGAALDCVTESITKTLKKRWKSNTGRFWYILNFQT